MKYPACSALNPKESGLEYSSSQAYPYKKSIKRIILLKVIIGLLFVCETNYIHSKEIYVSNISNSSYQISSSSNNQWKSKAAAKMKIKDYKQAIYYLTRAIKLNKKDYEAFYQRGLSKFRLKNYKGAIIDLSQSIKFRKKYNISYLYRGNIRLMYKDYEGAIKDYEKALLLNNKDVNWMAYQNLATSKEKLGDYQGAIDYYSKVIQLDPENLNIYIKRGDLLFDLKSYRPALNDYNKAIELDPEDPYLYAAVGSTKMNLNDYLGACYFIRKASSLGHENSKEWLINNDDFCQKQKDDIID